MVPISTTLVQSRTPPRTFDLATSANEFTGKRVTVQGLGRFGGGVGVTRFLVAHGANVTVTDPAPAEELVDSVAALRDLPVERLTLRLGEHRKEDFKSCDLLIANPAVPPRNEYLQTALSAGVPVKTEIQVLIERLPNASKIIGVTGSAGKSTVTAMIAAGINAQATCHLGGNFGGSLLNKLDQVQPDDWVVLELSSFMLWHLDRAKWSPAVAVITNLSGNHLDWHETFAHYRDCKQAILQHQNVSHENGDRCVLTEQANQHFAPLVEAVPIDTHRPLDLAVPGAHNVLNAQTAFAAIQAAGLDTARASRAIADFRGLPHRLCLVHEQNGVCYFDDSKCTTPEAAILALKAFPPGVCRIILGGYDKGAAWESLARHVVEHAKAVYTIGATGKPIADAIESACQSESTRPESCGGVSWRPGPDVHLCGDLPTAVQAIQKQSQAGDYVLLSPACASWDQFTDFQERGHLFQSLVSNPS